MKYIWPFLLLLILMTGCEKKNTKNQITLTYQKLYYEVATPYKKAINPHYTISTTTYDTDSLEKELMTESMDYFKPNNSLFQEGQYINREDSKLWLDQEHLNKAPKVSTNQISFQPNYIIGIHEQNYLAHNGTIKGISVALVLTSKVTYQKNGTYYTYQVETSEVLKYAQEKANMLVTELRKKEPLKNVRILIGLYVVNEPSMIPYPFQSIGIAEKDTIKWENTNHIYTDLTSSTVEKKDTNTYLAMRSMEKKLKEEFKTCTLQGIGSYQKNQLEEAMLKVYCPLLSNREVLYLTQQLSSQMIDHFENSMVSLQIQSGNLPKAVVTKKAGSSKSEITIWEG